MNNLTVNLENLTTEEREQLTKLIEKSNEPEMIKCTSGAYCIEGNAKVYQHGSSRPLSKLGLEYETEEEAEKENAALTELRIINNIIRQENKRTGFVVDWSNGAQRKVFIAFDHNEDKFSITGVYGYGYLACEVCDRESADRILDWLNKGMIEGITRGKIK